MFATRQRYGRCSTPGQAKLDLRERQSSRSQFSDPCDRSCSSQDRNRRHIRLPPPRGLRPPHSLPSREARTQNFGCSCPSAFAPPCRQVYAIPPPKNSLPCHHPATTSASLSALPDDVITSFRNSFR